MTAIAPNDLYAYIFVAKVLAVVIVARWVKPFGFLVSLAFDDTILFPGHDYVRLPHATIGEQKKTNPYLKFASLKQFLAAMGYR
jgi:hypothetical protein